MFAVAVLGVSMLWGGVMFACGVSGRARMRRVCGVSRAPFVRTCMLTRFSLMLDGGSSALVLGARSFTFVGACCVSSAGFMTSAGSALLHRGRPCGAGVHSFVVRRHTSVRLRTLRRDRHCWRNIRRNRPRAPRRRASASDERLRTVVT